MAKGYGAFIIMKKTIQACLIMFVTLGIFWGVSNAEILSTPVPVGVETMTRNFSAIGVVASTSEMSISVINTKSTDSEKDAVYVFDLHNLKKIEDKSYTPLPIFDIKKGSKIIVQGTKINETISIKRIILMSAPETPSPVILVNDPPVEVSTTTTIEVTNIIEVASTTEATSTEPNSVLDSAVQQE